MPREILSTAAQPKERAHEQVDTNRGIAGFHLRNTGVARPEHPPRLLLSHLPPRSLLSQCLRKLELELDDRRLASVNPRNSMAEPTFHRAASSRAFFCRFIVSSFAQTGRLAVASQSLLAAFIASPPIARVE
jgi:hypothetical protein